MPVTKSAKKALRKDKRREDVNKAIRTKMKSIIDQATEKPAQEQTASVYSVIDRAAKKNIIHKNKASRIKARLIRQIKKASKRSK